MVARKTTLPSKRTGGPKAPAAKNMKPINKVTSPATKGKSLPPWVAKAQNSVPTRGVARKATRRKGK